MRYFEQTSCSEHEHTTTDDEPKGYVAKHEHVDEQPKRSDAKIVGRGLRLLVLEDGAVASHYDDVSYSNLYGNDDYYLRKSEK